MNPRIGIISTYPPTECGLATFTEALVAELRASSATVEVLRLVDAPGATAPRGGGGGELVRSSPSSLAAALSYLNRLDAVMLQHEYGIYGGPDGIDVLDLVTGLTRPLIVVAHTVLAEPTPSQRYILEQLVQAAAVVVTMTHAARTRLVDIYGADPALVEVIPHGAHARTAPTALRAPSRPLILTWGLLGPGKGIEWMIDAMPALRDLRPRYLIVGKTHPKVAARSGEAYREMLTTRIADRRVQDLVELDNSYIARCELTTIVARADAIVLPYDSVDQATSGVLIEAVAAGRPVVSTGFPHAEELLADGTGLLVSRGSAAALSGAVRRVLTDPDLSAHMSQRSAQKAPELRWDAVAARYRALAQRLAVEALARSA